MMAYERLTALDRFFVDIESYNTHMHVAAVMLFESAPLANAAPPRCLSPATWAS